jgi:hypothetical protein
MIPTQTHLGMNFARNAEPCVPIFVFEDWRPISHVLVLILYSFVIRRLMLEGGVWLHHLKGRF